MKTHNTHSYFVDSERMHEIPLHCDVRIERPVYDTENLRQTFEYHRKEKNEYEKRSSPCSFHLRKCIITKVPLLESLSVDYDWKTDFLLDIRAGITIGIIQIPQGMAYALLGNVPPIVGVYMSFFPVLIHSFLGSSRHSSIGVFSVGCIMTGKVVLEYSTPQFFDGIDSLNNTVGENMQNNRFYSPIQVATTVTFATAIFQFMMYTLRLGHISVILSDKLISGFISGAAVQVAVFVLKDLFELKIPIYTGCFQTIYTCRDVFVALQNVNYATTFLSLITIAALTLDIMILKPFISKFTMYPFPSELVIIVISTGISALLDISDNYGVSTIGAVPTGLPCPSVPPLELLHLVLLDAFAIALTSYALTLSIALIPVMEHRHQIDANQELLALGFGNLFGSFFSCMPSSASFTKTLIQNNLGGKTQITALTSCGVLLVVMLWIGPLFETLPKCILAALVLVTLKSYLWEITKLPDYWKLSKTDAIIWLSTFTATVCIHIDVGLIVGIIVSVISLLIIALWPQTCLLGHIPQTDIFLDKSRYKQVIEVPGVKIFHYSGSINFATKAYFMDKLYTHVEMNPITEAVSRRQLTQLLEGTKLGHVNNRKKAKIEELQNKVHYDLNHIILSFSSVNHLDTSGVDMLKTIVSNFRMVNVEIAISGCSDAVYDMMTKCRLLETEEYSVKSYPTVKDATETTKPLCSSVSYICHK